MITRGNFKLKDLTSEEWGYLPTHFKDSLKQAQLIEACVILGGDPIGDRRDQGLLSKTVGESSEMFRAGMPTKHAISPTAMAELRGYIDRSVRISR